MKGFFIGIGVVLSIIFMPIVLLWSTYNGLVTSNEHVNQTYAQVQNVMQRQAELIPNLVETVKGYAQHESKTLTQVTEARSKLTAVAKMSPADLANNPELQKQLIEAQASSSQAMTQINATAEAYPQLRANENFRELMSELAGSQNRITTERRRNQLAVQAYNIKTQTAVSGFVARMYGFAPKPYYEAPVEAQRAPQVRF